jgi:hypothetical protein
LILDFNTLDGLNTRTWRGRIGTSSPVLGLRPIRSFFERTWNEPKEQGVADQVQHALHQFGRFGAGQAHRLVDRLG